MAPKKTILDVVYSQYNQHFNMTLKELRAWDKNPISKKVSKNKKPLMMAMRLRSKPKSRWGLTEVKWALKKSLPFLKKARKGMLRRRTKTLTKKQALLRNWGYDIKKKRRS